MGVDVSLRALRHGLCDNELLSVHQPVVPRIRALSAFCAKMRLDMGRAQYYSLWNKSSLALCHSFATFNPFVGGDEVFPRNRMRIVRHNDESVRLIALVSTVVRLRYEQAGWGLTMAIITCRGCGGWVHSKANACPKCGMHPPTPYFRLPAVDFVAVLRVVGFVVVSFFAVLAITNISVFPSDKHGLKATVADSTVPLESTITEPPAPVQARSANGDERTMEQTYVGCRTEEQFSIANQSILQHDGQALARMVLTNQCTTLARGSIVYLVDTAIFHGQIKVRQRGQTEGWWTAIELVSKAH